MLLRTRDFNDAGKELAAHREACQAVEDVLATLQLQLKASDQANIQGTPIFDPVGTNAMIKQGLVAKGLRPNLRVPPEFRFLGTDVDFAVDGILVEVQFSNYPFLLNNLLRSELFYKSNTSMPDEPMRAAIIITKAHMFKASNSTLYYEQAAKQLSALAEHSVFDVPIRLIGLFAPKDEQFTATFNIYTNPRYSRTLESTTQRKVIAQSGVTTKSRCTIKFAGS